MLIKQELSLFLSPSQGLAASPQPGPRGSARLRPRAPGRARDDHGPSDFSVFCTTLGPMDREANYTHRAQPSGSLCSSRGRSHSARKFSSSRPTAAPQRAYGLCLCEKLRYAVRWVSPHPGLQASCRQELGLVYRCIASAQHGAWPGAGAG